MKLLFDARMQFNSGIGTYISNLYPFIKEHFDTTPIKSPKSHWEDGLFAKSGIYGLKEQLELNSISRKVQHDRFWSPHFNIPILEKQELITTIHDCFHLEFYQTLPLAQQVYARYFFDMATKKSKKIITISKYSANQLRKHTNIDSNKIEIIYNGVSQDWFTEENKKTDFDFPYLLFVGNLKPNKNLSGLLQAFEKIKNSINHKLVVVGQIEGFNSKEFDVQSALEQFNERLIFTGKVTFDELKALYKDADLFCFPSLYEGFGLPTLEAMSQNTNVLTSAKLPMEEFLGDKAFYCNPWDPDDIARNILISLNNKKDGLREFASKLTWEESAKSTIEVLKS